MGNSLTRKTISVLVIKDSCHRLENTIKQKGITSCYHVAHKLNLVTSTGLVNELHKNKKPLSRDARTIDRSSVLSIVADIFGFN